jgi:PAS domain-containing protein
MDPGNWRRRAEEQVEAEEPEAPDGVELRRVVHELRVHQLELEMQNEALDEARTQAEAGWERFQELYDFAPAGYFSVDRLGTILELNLAGARLLGSDRPVLFNRRFSHFLSGPDQAVFAAFLKQGLERQAPPPCEVSLPAGTRVRLQGAGSVDGKVLQMAALDMTELSEAQGRASLVCEELQRRVDLLASQLEAAQVELDSIRRILPQQRRDA